MGAKKVKGPSKSRDFVQGISPRHIYSTVALIVNFDAPPTPHLCALYAHLRELLCCSPYLYNDTLYVMAGLVSCASLLHLAVRPVDTKFFEKEEQQDKR